MKCSLRHYFFPQLRNPIVLGSITLSRLCGRFAIISPGRNAEQVTYPERTGPPGVSGHLPLGEGPFEPGFKAPEAFVISKLYYEPALDIILEYFPLSAQSTY